MAEDHAAEWRAMQQALTDIVRALQKGPSPAARQHLIAFGQQLQQAIIAAQRGVTQIVPQAPAGHRVRLGWIIEPTDKHGAQSDPPMGEAAPQAPCGAPAAATPRPRPAMGAALQAEFDAWVAAAEIAPDLPATDAWAADHKISRVRGRELRRNCSEDRLHRRGRRPRK